MASDYSPLKIELIKTGEQVATWGQTTNTNLGTAIEQAIGGKADVTMSSTSITLSLTNSNAAQDARALYLNLTGTPGGAATLNVPAVQKAYIVRNGTTGGFAVTVKVTGQTGVSVPNGATMHLYNNGTDVVNAMTNLPAGATIGGSPIGTGGGSVTSVTGTGTVNGITLTGNVTSSGNITLGGTLSNVDLSTQVTNTLPTNRGGTGQTVAAYCSLTTNVNGILPIANGGTGSSSTTYCSLTTNVAGTLPVANGGTGNSTLTANAALIGNGTGAVLGLSPGADGNVMTSNGTTWTSAALPASVSSFSAGTTGFTPNTATTGAVTLAGTLSVSNGGTGQITAQAAINALAGATTSGQFLRGNGTNVVMSAIQASDVPTLNQNTTGTADNVTGLVLVGNGGTGRSSLTANNVLIGNGTSAVDFVAPSTSGNALVSTGSSWASGNPARLSTASGSAPSYSARAWVNFDGTNAFSPNPSTTAIRASGNVSSITDNGVGDYTVNFTTAMSDANYNWVGGAKQTSGDNVFVHGSPAAQTTSALSLYTSQAGLGLVDPLIVNVSIFR